MIHEQEIWYRSFRVTSLTLFSFKNSRRFLVKDMRAVFFMRGNDSNGPKKMEKIINFRDFFLYLHLVQASSCQCIPSLRNE